MKLYSQIKLKETREIIILKNKGWSNYGICQETGVSKGKIRRCCSYASALVLPT